MAYDRLGQRKKAEEILRSYLFYRLDYFTNMYLYTYCYYAARAYEYLGEKEKGDALMENMLSADLKELTKKDWGISIRRRFLSVLSTLLLKREKFILPIVSICRIVI